jgi:beta-galactosidase
MSTLISLGDSWRYLPRFEPSFVTPTLSLADWEEVDLPHANLELAYNGFDEKSYQFISSYARELSLPPLAEGARVFLDFEGVMTACELWVNGRPAGGHLGGFTPFSVEIGGLLGSGANRLLLKVDSTERPDLPPFGHVVDYLCYGGVYRGVNLRVTGAAFLKEVFARPIAAGRGASARVEIGVEVDAGEGRSSPGLEARARLLDRADGKGRVLAEARAAAGADGRAELAMEAAGELRLWELGDPALYDLELGLLEDGVEVDGRRQRLGFRTAEWRKDGFFLNGRRVKLAGLNRHQSWPYAGYAMPARAQRRDAEILKRELGVNLVRTSHYPQSPAFLEACDELGLLVFEELPGWQHLGDAAWKDRACEALEEMIRRDRNHPSVVLWGTRINESKDDHGFYARTAEIAHRLDPSRSTGGVRYIQKSELLEDVYTFNDFVHNGVTPPLRRPRKVTGLGRDVPYLVTEHNGHMYPTKRFDNEERLAEQARRHARVLDAAFGDPRISGAVGWCAFDYNTHKDFGSGDRICYHGVSDMFRIPKYAAALYASQAEPSAGIVMEPATLFAKGERSGARVLPIEIYTNCDEVVLSRGGVTIGSFLPDRKAYPNLPHPPVVLRDLVGDQLAGGPFSPRDQERIKRIVGRVLTDGLEGLSRRDLLSMGLFLLRNRMSLQEGEDLVGKYALGWGAADESWELAGLLGGQEVIRRGFGGDAVARRLVAKADDPVLERAGLPLRDGGGPSGEGWDCTRVVIRLIDQYGNTTPFVPECVDVELTGPGRLIGPSRLALIGGCIAFWVRTTGQAGEIGLRIRGTRYEAEALSIRVV